MTDVVPQYRAVYSGTFSPVAVALIVPQFLHAVTFVIIQSIRNPSIIEIVPSPCPITGLTRRIVSAVHIVFTDTAPSIIDRKVLHRRSRVRPRHRTPPFLEI